MNDPHVVALIYAIRHSASVRYDDARPLSFNRPDFSVTVKDRKARFVLADHYATVPEAQERIQPFIDRWTFETSVQHGSCKFDLTFEQSEVIDRQPDPPMPGIKSISAQFSGAPGTITAKLAVSKQYPPPPSEDLMDIHDPDVQTMLHRYTGYRQGHEPLPSMAYFCCEVFTTRLSNDTKDAADKHKISHNLIKQVNNLASNKGGSQARHAHAVEHPLTSDEQRFLEKAVVAMIIRAAKAAGDPNQRMPWIHLGNLLEISP